ncbi:MAG: AsmA family protein [Proteobacteria bacterium]|nr:AsmA family protein [Pseudomonadota bacterium]
MKQFIRYGVVPAGIFFILFVVTVILVPILVNVQKFVPGIEQQISEATGREFSLGPDLNVSFFPWLSISFSDLKIGNPPGFQSEEFVKVRTFEARIKVLPLLRKQIQISRFVVGGLSVNLEKNDSGRVNWEFGPEGSGKKSENPTPWSFGLLSEKLSFVLLAVTDGQVTWNDRTKNVQYAVEDIMLLLNDFTPDRPVSLDCKATFDGRPVTVEGKAGPFIEKNSLGALPIDIAFSVVNMLRGQVRGKITQQEKTPGFELSVNLAPFSPRDFFSACDLPFPKLTKDSEIFKRFALEFSVRGEKDKITIKEGTAQLDDSKLNFSLLWQGLKSPRVDFVLDLDRIDLDRYLASPAENDKTTERVPGQKEHAYGEPKILGWRDIALAGVIQLGELKIHGGSLTELNLPVQGKEGVFTLAPATFKASQGQVEAALTLDLRDEEPTMQATLKAQGLQAEPLSRDFIGRDYLRGNLSAELALQFAGGNRATMKRTLSGEATLLVQDGAVIGVEINQMLGNPESQHGTFSENISGEKPWTDFTEAKSVVTINNGLVQISEMSLRNPACNLQLSGTADIVGQQLNLQMETGFVTTVVGKGGREEKVDHSDIYSISGTFSEPELTNQKALSNGSNAGGRNNINNLVAQKLSFPAEVDVKNLVGKDLVDPAVVARHFRLQPETLRRSEIKKKLSIGTGKVRIGTLQEEINLH